MFPFPSMDLHDPLVMVFSGLLGVGVLLGAPVALGVWLLEAFTLSGAERYSAADRARLVQRERRRQAGRLARAVTVPGAPVVVPALPWTPAQHARYDDMRAKGWSDLASRQALERLPQVPVSG